MIETVWQVYEVTCLQVKLTAKYSENSGGVKFVKALVFSDVISKIFSNWACWYIPIIPVSPEAETGGW